MCGFPIQAADAGKLLSTDALARQVNTLSVPLGVSPGTTVETRRKAGFEVRDKIGQFIVDQIEAKPDITKEQLRAQLQAILCSARYAVCGGDQPPHVFANSWFGPRGSSQFVVAYQLGLGFMGPSGSITTIESYFVDNGKARRAACAGSEFAAYVVNFQMVQQFFKPSPEIWVLAWGTVEGASGRGLHGRATVYRASADSVTIAWDEDSQDNLTAQTNAIGWEVNYADNKLLYGNGPKPYFFDVYEIDYQKRTFSRVVHYQHAAD